VRGVRGNYDPDLPLYFDKSNGSNPNELLISFYDGKNMRRAEEIRSMK